MTKRLDITKAMINCNDDIVVDANNKNVSVAYELWFDVDSYFGTDTGSTGDTWIDFYTEWNPMDGSITPLVLLETDQNVEELDWAFTATEAAFFRQKMEDYAAKLYGVTLEQLWKEAAA
jgi:hypothetical protein